MYLVKASRDPSVFCRRCCLRVKAGPSRSFHITARSHRVAPQKPFPTSGDNFGIRPSNSEKSSPVTNVPRLSPQIFLSEAPPSPRRLIQTLLSRLPEWTGSQRVKRKLEAYGFEELQYRSALSQWESAVRDNLHNCRNDREASAALATYGWDEANLTRSFDRDGTGFANTVEAAFMRHFLTRCVTATSSLPKSLRAHVKTLLDTTDLSRMAFVEGNIRARAMHRNFHLHVGPTNSGKTYSALKSLAAANSGAYAGPLRLLAHEIWERLNLGTVGDLNGKSKKCNLLTGEERRIVDPEAGLLSCTVEMLPLRAPSSGGQAFDVVVIDEIQMMGDSNRGGSWTRAVLGVRAKEIHLCGDETTVDLLKDITASLGDTLTIHQYERLTPLTVAEESLEGDFNNVQPGDCVVTFSRSNIFAVKKAIEEKTGRKCAVVYGALPPETRADQARAFNDDDGPAEILVASDAVGMGLNLCVKPISQCRSHPERKLIFINLQEDQTDGF